MATMQAAITTMTENFSSPALLRLLNLVSPSLPIGTFAYSQGLEFAIEKNWVHNEESMQDWLLGVMTNSLATLDIPILKRCHFILSQQPIAWAEIEQWNDYLLANRESRELYLEDIQIGAALTRLLQSLECDGAAQLKTLTAAMPTAFAVAAAHWKIPLREAALGFLWSWAENQVSVSTKTIPLGQTAGQRILDTVLEAIPAIVDKGLSITDNDIGSNLPGLAIASALHETQYSRLFRS